MAKKQRRAQKQKFVRGNERKPVHRPEPPHNDRRTKRARTRSDEKRQSIADHS